MALHCCQLGYHRLGKCWTSDHSEDTRIILDATMSNQLFLSVQENVRSTHLNTTSLPGSTVSLTWVICSLIEFNKILHYLTCGSTQTLSSMKFLAVNLMFYHLFCWWNAPWLASCNLTLAYPVKSCQKLCASNTITFCCQGLLHAQTKQNAAL